MSKIKLAEEAGKEPTVDELYRELLIIHGQQGQSMQRVLDKNMELGEKVQTLNKTVAMMQQADIEKSTIIEKRIADVNQKNNDYLEDILNQRTLIADLQEEIKRLKERLGEE